MLDSAHFQLNILTGCGYEFWEVRDRFEPVLALHKNNENKAKPTAVDPKSESDTEEILEIPRACQTATLSRGPELLSLAEPVDFVVSDADAFRLGDHHAL